MRFIGDVHGKFRAYTAIAEAATESIQVGDFGVGFGLDAPVVGPKHHFIRGNHDNPEECNNHIAYLGDFGIDFGMFGNIFFAGGAFSIDKEWRTPGLDWWAGEELTEEQRQKAGDIYVKNKPPIVVTHCCPAEAQTELFHFPNEYPNPTIYFLSSLLIFHKPKVWIFGHYHRSVDRVLDGVRYIGLNELKYIDLDVDSY